MNTELPKRGQEAVASSELLAALFEQFRDADELVRERERDIMDRDLVLASLRLVRDTSWWKYESARKESAANDKLSNSARTKTDE